MTDLRPNGTTLVITASQLGELSKPVGLVDGLSGIDKRLLRMAQRGASPVEMGEECGISPARAIGRIKEILKSKTYLSHLERQELLLFSMMELQGDLKDIVDEENQDDRIVGYNRNGQELYGRGDPRWAANLIKLQGNIAKMLESGLRANAAAKNAVYAEDARVMGQGIEIAFQNFAKAIAKDYPNIEEQYLREQLESALEVAFTYLNSQAVNDEDEA